MGRLADAVRSILGPVNSSDRRVLELFGDGATASGVGIDECTALNLSAVWAAVQVISGTIASLPLILYKRLDGGGRERFYDHPLYRLLHDEPNPEMTSFVFRQTLQAHVLVWGNAYAEIQRDQNGRVVALWIITPDRVQPYRDSPAGPLRYRVTNNSGNQVELRPENILHVPGLGWDGTQGYSVIRKARESLGLLSATERFGAAFFGNGAQAGHVATMPGKLTDVARANIINSIADRHQGPGQAHRLMILEEGLKLEKTTIPPNDAQFLETRRFQTVEVARWFNLPPHKLRDLERATFTNIEAQGLDFVIDLRLWMIPWELEIGRKLIKPLERRIQYVEHLVDSLLRGDIASRYTAYAVGRQWGWLSPDDIREKENLNPLPGGAGQMYLTPTNMTPANRVNEVIDAQIAPKPAPPSPPSSPRTDLQLAEIAENLRRLQELGGDTLARQDDVQRQIAAIPAPIPVDLGSVLEQLADVRAAIPPPADLTPVLEAVMAIPAAPPVDLTPVLARVDAVRAELAAIPGPIATDLTPVLDRLATAEAVKERIAQLAVPLRSLIEAAVRDLVRREADRARRASSSRVKLADWVAGFYPQQEDYAVRTLGATMQLYSILVGRPEETEAVIRRRIAAHIAESREALAGLALLENDELRSAVEILSRRWEMQRPAQFADALLQEVLAHV